MPDRPLRQCLSLPGLPTPHRRRLRHRQGRSPTAASMPDGMMRIVLPSRRPSKRKPLAKVTTPMGIPDNENNSESYAWIRGALSWHRCCDRIASLCCSGPEFAKTRDGVLKAISRMQSETADLISWIWNFHRSLLARFSSNHQVEMNQDFKSVLRDDVSSIRPRNPREQNDQDSHTE